MLCDGRATESGHKRSVQLFAAKTSWIGDDLRMDQDLLRIAKRVLEVVEADGQDYIVVTETAVRQILAIRPDVTASDALLALSAARRES